MFSLRSREFGWLVRKEFRELFASRAFWLLLLVIGPLVGQSFITAVDAYAEASGIGGGPSALAQGLSPLDGIFVPALGAYDLAVTLLFPFVVIHLVAGEKQSGAWKLMLQTSSGISTHLAAKVLVIFAGWLLAWVPGVAVLVYWKLLGGTLYGGGRRVVIFSNIGSGRQAEWQTLPSLAAQAGLLPRHARRRKPPIPRAR